MESRAGDLQTQMSAEGEELEAELAAERQARWLAEAEVAGLRQQTAAGGTSLADKARMEHELTTLRAELDRTRQVADEHAAASGEAKAIIADLTSASERLRAETPALADDEPAPGPDLAAPVLPSGPQSPITQDAAPEPELPTRAGRRGRHPLAARRCRARRGGHGGAACGDPGARARRRPRAARPAPHLRAERPTAPWLAPAIERLAARNPAAAAKLVVGLLPVQRLMVSNDAIYDLTVTELGTFRVQLHAGATTVEPRAEPGPRKEIDFHLEGPAAALAELAAGGARRRPKGTHFEGSRRKLKRLLKDLRDPVDLPDVARSGAVIEPGLILAALAAASIRVGGGAHVHRRLGRHGQPRRDLDRPHRRGRPLGRARPARGWPDRHGPCVAGRLPAPAGRLRAVAGRAGDGHRQHPRRRPPAPVVRPRAGSEVGARKERGERAARPSAVRPATYHVAP